MVQPSQLREDAVVAAARAGDRAALNELARRCLPLVYNLVRQALPGDAAVDDVVQDVMVRAFRQLPDLRATSSFRPWLAAIAVRQVSSHLAREDVVARRVVPLETALGRPDAGAEFEGAALLRTELSAQRRQVGHAVRWMSPDDRAVYSLWWLETAGELSRPEVAAALETNVAHAGVRLQRMREQLDLSRKIVAALDAMPGCDGLAEVIADWDAVPNSFWRKRIGRHVLTCPVCAPTARRLVAAERLLAGLVLLPVPAGLAAAVGAKAGTTLWLGRLAQAAAAHPVMTTVSVGVLALGIAVPVTQRPSAVPPARAEAVAPHRLSGTGTPRPDPTAALLQAGPVSLESADQPGRYVAVVADEGVLSAATDAGARKRATLHAVAGLADPSCFSFRDPDGRYLRHSSFRLRLSADEGTVLFRQDATFCARAGFQPGSLSLESFNYRGFFVRHVGTEMWIDQNDGSAPFHAAGSFFVRRPLG
ncbi:sigma-70 family RNA polymerase sigma factor [Actinoplanes sp. NPDC051411]|uniref:sigma-70 family RNA polymerase sigma factor n=1 Tax=Actinoplanes sp. NPDC051411 TaxID=3155522 RepID=UPI0034324B1E